MICKNLKELEKELYKRINTALDEDVSDVVKDVMTDHIIQDVYDVCNPVSYERRYNQAGINIDNGYDDSDNTGLLDVDNIIATIDGEGNLFVQNITLGSRYYYDKNKKRISQNAGKPIANIIETGEGYDIWDANGTSRPFMRNTHDDLKENHYHTQAMKQGLKRQGLEVK